MALTKEQIKNLVGMVASSGPDELDCDGCFEQLAEFAEAQLMSQKIPAALQAITLARPRCPGPMTSTRSPGFVSGTSTDQRKPAARGLKSAAIGAGSVGSMR